MSMMPGFLILFIDSQVLSEPLHYHQVPQALPYPISATQSQNCHRAYYSIGPKVGKCVINGFPNARHTFTKPPKDAKKDPTKFLAHPSFSILAGPKVTFSCGLCRPRLESTTGLAIVLSLYAGVLSGTGQMVAAVAVERGLGWGSHGGCNGTPFEHLVVR